MKHLLLAPVLLAAIPATAQAPLPYRALGTNPYWSLSIGENIRLEQPGRQPIVVPRTQGRPSFNGMRYVTPAMTIDVTHSRCRDELSSNVYPDTVTVATNGRTLRGCGGVSSGEDRADYRLGGTRWRIAAIDNHAVNIDRVTQVRFGGTRIEGNAGCNSFGGNYDVQRNRMTTSRVISTRMACSGRVMQVETRFMRLLSEPVQISFPNRQTLVLRGRDGTATLVAR